MLLDVRLPGMSGLDLLRIVKEQQPLIEVIVISAVSEVETAVQAMKQGAYHYITKDFEYDALRSLVRNAAEKQDLNRRVLALSAQVAEQSEREFVIGPSPAHARRDGGGGARWPRCRPRCSCSARAAPARNCSPAGSTGTPRRPTAPSSR